MLMHKKIMFDRYNCIKYSVIQENSIIFKKMRWEILIFGDRISAKKSRSLHHRVLTLTQCEWILYESCL